MLTTVTGNSDRDESGIKRDARSRSAWSRLGCGPRGRAEDDEDDDAPANPSTEPPLAAPIELRLSRRAALTGLAATAVAGALGSGFPTRMDRALAGASSLAFREVAHGMTTGLQSAPGYSAQVLIRWGDKVLADAPAFDVANQSAAAQETQVGYNNDFMAYMRCRSARRTPRTACCASATSTPTRT